MTKIFIYGSLVLGLSCMAAGWARAGYWSLGLFFLILIPVSLYLFFRGFRPITGLVLAFTVLTAAVGLWARIELSLALTAVVCILAAWDLSGFSSRLAYASPEDDPERLERRHLAQVNLVLFIGVGLNLVTQIFRYSFGFEWTFLLAILTFYGIGALISGMHVKSD